MSQQYQNYGRTFGKDLMRGEGKRHVVTEEGEFEHSGTSVFDPVLCEIAYRWFAPAGGTVLDPFAGGSVRGIVAAHLGLSYVGIDLRAAQVAANQAQAERICEGMPPIWIEGDARNIDKLAAGTEADLIFSCPPYLGLERYSDDPDDLSTMSPEVFRRVYNIIIGKAVDMLKPDRFAVWVIGDVRDDQGFYVGLPWWTIEAFAAAGAPLYNEAILVNPVGSLAVRVSRQFTAARKLGKTHQQVLVFCKGDPVKATKACGEVQFGDPGLPGAEVDPSNYGEPL